MSGNEPWTRGVCGVGHSESLPKRESLNTPFPHSVITDLFKLSALPSPGSIKGNTANSSPDAASANDSRLISQSKHPILLLYSFRVVSVTWT